MCGGPTSTQEELQQEEADFYRTQTEAYKTAYSKFTDITSKLNAQFEPVLAAGINQYGFSPGEEQTLTSQAIEGTAKEYAKAKAALGENIGALGGGQSNENITSGESNQMREELASTAAGVQSGSLLSIKKAGYDLGRENFLDAEHGEEALAAGWDPNTFAGSADNSAKVANDEANTIAAQQNSIWTSVIGALGGVAGGFAGDFEFGGKHA